MRTSRTKVARFSCGAPAQYWAFEACLLRSTHVSCGYPQSIHETVRNNEYFANTPYDNTRICKRTRLSTCKQRQISDIHFMTRSYCMLGIITKRNICKLYFQYYMYMCHVGCDRFELTANGGDIYYTNMKGMFQRKQTIMCRHVRDLCLERVSKQKCDLCVAPRVWLFDRVSACNFTVQLFSFLL